MNPLKWENGTREQTMAYKNYRLRIKALTIVKPKEERAFLHQAKVAEKSRQCTSSAALRLCIRLW